MGDFLWFINIRTMFFHTTDHLANEQRSHGGCLDIVIITNLSTHAADVKLTPMTMSFDVPKMKYTHAPVNVVYKPYAGVSPARDAYAIAWGTTTKPTVTPV